MQESNLNLDAEMISNVTLQKTITVLNSTVKTEATKQSNIIKSYEVKIKEINSLHEEAMNFLEEKLRDERERSSQEISQSKVD